MNDYQVAELINRLAQTPTTIAALVTGRNDAALTKAGAAEQWTAAEILAHLRAADDILSHRVYALLVRDTPLLPALDERLWADIAGYSTMTFAASLTTYAARRAELVAALQRLPLAAWERTGAHDVNGSFTLWTLVQHIAAHEEEHCQQLVTLFTT